jgi:F-type H+-transporting ATPase subunit gamma
MKREHSLRRRLRSLETLSEAVGAMKSLSAHHLRSARAALPAARAYRQGIDDALAVIGLHQRESPGDAPAILLVAADLGLCGGYNSQLAAAALDYHGRLNARRVYCVGHRPLSLFKRADVKVDREYSAPTSVLGLTELLLRIGEDLLVDYLDGTFGTLNVISAQFDGVGEFTPTCTRLLPIDPPASVSSMKPSAYVSSGHLAAVAVREYLYIRLFQTSLESLASEHGARLVATESAGEWLSEKTAVARRQLASIRREAATQEVLDIAATARRRKHPGLSTNAS